MQSAIILVVITLLTMAGDYYIKLASARPDGLLTAGFALGVVLYALPALGWFFLMRSHSLAAIGVFYSSATILLLAALGTLVFGEAFGLREGIGVTLAVAAVVVMGWGH